MGPQCAPAASGAACVPNASAAALEASVAGFCADLPQEAPAAAVGLCCCGELALQGAGVRCTAAAAAALAVAAEADV